MKVIKCEPYDDVWWESRRGVPSTSEFGSIITPKREEFAAASHAYACQLIAEHFDGDYGPQSDFQTAAMKNGHIMEPESRNYYEFHRNCDVERVGFITTDDGRFGSSPDALVGEDGLLELKNPGAEAQVKYLLGGTLPEIYKPQCHGQLIVSGRKWMDFLSYHPGLPKLLVRVEPNEFTEKLRACMEQFWTLYQGLLARIRAQREEAIDEAIERKGQQLPKDLASFIITPEGAVA